MFIKIAHRLTSRKKFGQSRASVLYFSRKNDEINTTPYGAWFCIVPDFSRRRVFECTSYVLIKDNDHEKMINKCVIFIFICYRNTVRVRRTEL